MRPERGAVARPVGVEARLGCDGAVGAEEVAEPFDARIVAAEEVDEPSDRGMEVGGPGLGDRLDIGPVLRAVEEGLEDHELGRAEHRDRHAGEGHPVDVDLRGVVERMRGEEEVDRRVVPEEAHLPVATDASLVGRAVGDAVGQRGEDRVDLIGREEHVDVDVTRPARLLDVEREGERAAEGVRDLRPGERGLQRDDRVDQAGHQARRGKASSRAARRRAACRRARAPAPGGVRRPWDPDPSPPPAPRRRHPQRARCAGTWRRWGHACRARRSRARPATCGPSAPAPASRGPPAPGRCA